MFELCTHAQSHLQRRSSLWKKRIEYSMFKALWKSRKKRETSSWDSEKFKSTYAY